MTGDTLRGELQEQGGKLIQFRQNDKLALQEYTSAQIANLSLPITARYVFIDKRTRWYIKAGLGPTLTTIGDANFVSSDLGITIPVEILHHTNLGVGYLAGLGTNLLINRNYPIYVEARVLSHAVLDGVTNIAISQSLQWNVSVPLVRRY